MKNLNLKTKLFFLLLAIGVIPVLISGYYAYLDGKNSLEAAAFNQLKAVRGMKKHAVQGYFKTIDNQIKTFSENAMVIDAMTTFKSSFNDYVAESNPGSTESLRSKVKSYYNNQFAPEYRSQNENNSPDLSLLDTLGPEAVALQYTYIQNNPHPLGSKHKLDAAADSSSYSLNHGKVHPIIRSYLEKFNYYDIFLVDNTTGNVVYSVFKELDYATSLKHGPYANTGLGKAFKAAANATSKDFTYLTDYAQYFPSYEAPASFISSPIFNGDQLIGVAIFQMPIAVINEFMSERSGMGTSGESYLVGPDKLMRSDSFLNPKDYSVIGSFKKNNRADTEAISNALNGKEGAKIILDYNNSPVLSAYAPIDLGHGIVWAILAEIDVAEAFEPVYHLRLVMIVLTCIIIVVVALVGAYFGASISNPILNLTDTLRKIGIEVSEAASSFAASAQELSGTAGEQASSIEETSASLEEISGMIDNNVQNTEQTVSLSKDVSSVARTSNESVKNLKNSMSEILESNKKIEDLVRVIANIGEKTQIMDEIVFQTKLLSFNASVEAERAGEHGRGFAVVAQEVGNLAQMSGKSAQEIAVIVKQSMEEAQLITTDNKMKVDKGNSFVLETAKMLESIMNSSNTVLDGASQIMTASKEQATGIQQITQAVAHFDQATQQISQTAESSASSSDRLKMQVGSLKEVITEFIGLIQGK